MGVLSSVVEDHVNRKDGAMTFIVERCNRPGASSMHDNVQLSRFISSQVSHSWARPPSRKRKVDNATHGKQLGSQSAC